MLEDVATGSPERIQLRGGNYTDSEVRLRAYGPVAPIVIEKTNFSSLIGFRVIRLR